MRLVTMWSILSETDIFSPAELTGALFLVAALHQRGDVNVALVGDDALGIVVHLFFAVGYVLLEVLHERAVELELLEHLFVSLEHLYGVPAEEAPVDLALDALLDVGDGVLHAAVEDRGGDKFAVFPRELRRALRHGLGALALQGAGGHDLAAERVAQLLQVDLVAVLAHDVNHVHGHDRGDAQLDELGGEIEVSLYIRAVDYVYDGVRLFVHEVLARHDLFKRVRRE